MRDKDSDLILAGIIVLYSVYAYFAFKMYDDLLLDTPPDQSCNSIQGCGVSSLGKFGAWILLLCSVVSVIMLLARANYSNNARQKRFYKILGIVNLILAVVYALESMHNQWQLFVRALPYLVTQVGVAVWLLQKSECE